MEQNRPAVRSLLSSPRNRYIGVLSSLTLTLYINGSFLGLKPPRGFWKDLHTSERGREGIYNEEFSTVNAQRKGKPGGNLSKVKSALVASPLPTPALPSTHYSLSLSFFLFCSQPLSFTFFLSPGYLFSILYQIYFFNFLLSLSFDFSKLFVDYLTVQKQQLKYPIYLQPACSSQ